MRKHNAVWIFAAICILGAYVFFAPRAKYSGRPRPEVVNPESNPFVLPCSNGGEERDLTFSGTVLVDRIFLSERDESLSEPKAREIISEQLKFLFGLFAENEKFRNAGRFFRSSSSPQVTIDQIVSTNYGRSMIVDKPFEYGASDYVSRAIARGSTKTGDPAWKIQYTAKVRIGSCFKGPSVKALGLLLPFDPYLAFWIVPPSERRLRAWMGEQSVTTPCGSGEMAHLRFPFEYWIDWDPEARDRDLNNKTFDCAQLIKPGQDYGVFQASVSEPVKGPAFILGEPLKDESAPLRMALIQSPLEPWTRKLDTHEVARELTQVKGSLSLSAKETYTAATKRPGSKDPGYIGFLYFLANLSQVLDIEKNQISNLADASLTFLVTGTLKVSHRPIELQIYYGDTDVVGSKSAKHHWPFLLKALSESDVVLYLGHSGMGNNLSVERMLGDMHMSSDGSKFVGAKKKYQLIGAVSCNAYSYFPDGFKSLRLASGGDSKTDYVMMANSSFRPLFFLGLMRYIDRLIHDEHPSLYSSLESYMGSDDFIVFERSERAALN